jgi:membrane associated rhomboid family serine protease
VLFPYRDDNPHSTRPWLVIALVLANTAIFVYELTLGEAAEGFVRAAGAIPYEISRFRDVVGPGQPSALLPVPLTIFSAMFLHGSPMHLVGNMLYLWIFGDNLEHAMGRGRFLVFYLLTGVVAALVHVFSEPDSAVPMIGASGAIAGVLGGYALTYPHARVRCALVLFVIIQRVFLPAWIVLGFWFLMQFLSAAGGAPGVAWYAHIGGFAAGLVLVRAFLRHPPRRAPRYA